MARPFPARMFTPPAGAVNANLYDPALTDLRRARIGILSTRHVVIEVRPVRRLTIIISSFPSFVAESAMHEGPAITFEEV